MHTTESSARTLRFSSFEVDLRSAELRKHGVRIKLQDQPFRILSLLLEHPGDIVTREELRQQLWQDHTFVDFDRGLNKAIAKLRSALGDSAESPRYIETIPRHGYRLLVPVANANPGAEVGQLLPYESAPSGLTAIPSAVENGSGLLAAAPPRILPQLADTRRDSRLIVLVFVLVAVAGVVAARMRQHSILDGT